NNTLTVSGAASFTAAGTGLSVTNNATIGGTLAVTGAVTGGTYNGQTLGSATSLTGTLTVAGITTLSSLGAADTNSALCLNSTNQIATCAGSGSGAAFVQGGNSFNATGVLGTTDNYGLNIETDGNTALALDTSGNGTLTGNLTVSGTGTSTIGGKLKVNTSLGVGATALSSETLRVQLASGTGATIAGSTCSNNGSVALYLCNVDTSQITLAARAISSQTGNLFDLQNSSGTNLVAVTAGGYLTVAPTASTATSGSVVGSTFNLTASPSSASSAFFYASESLDTYNGTAANTGSVTGAINQAAQAAGSGVNVSLLNGSLNTAVLTGAGTVGSAIGTYGQANIQAAATGSITNAIALRAQVNNNSTGGASITNAYGLQVLSPVASATGTIGTDYGVYISPQAGTGVTTAYGLYQAGSSDLNYLAGNTGIGATASANEKLVVSSSVTDPSSYQYGTHSTLNITQTAANSNTAEALRGDLTVSGSGGNTGLLAAVYGQATYNNTGTGGINGGEFLVNQGSSGGGLTIARGLYTRVDNNSTNAIATAYGLQIANNTGTGSITNNIGLEINALSGTSTAYGIQVAAPTATTAAAINLSDTGGTAAGGLLFGTDTNLYRSAANTLKTDDSLIVGANLNVSGNSTLTGTLSVGGLASLSSLGTADTNSALCLNSTNQIATCAGSGSGAAFVQGGNNFGAQAVLGTKDNNSLALMTNNATRAVLDTSGNLTFQQASTISTSTGNLTLQAAGTSTLTLDTAGAGNINIGTNASTIRLGNGTGTETVYVGNSSGTDTVNIATGGGTDTVNIGTSSNSVSTNIYSSPYIKGGVNATGYVTSNTGSTYSGQYTLLGTCTLVAQYQDCHSEIAVVNTNDGTAQNYHTTVDFRVKQQAALGGAPIVNLTLDGTKTLTASQF
ncbi:MAG TPA: hypothetical protein VHA37_03950, partial [Candidatus Saccharimonadales bacterium]|nr:hypothetical protein [Candidatus Saccharimonadales bacterium]